MKTALKPSHIGPLLLVLGLALHVPLQAEQTVDGDGNIMIQPNGKPARGRPAEDMPSILFKAAQSGPHRLANARMWSAPTIMVLCDSDGTELGRNITDEDVEAFVQADLEEGQLYFLILAAIKEEDHGKPFSISLATTGKAETPEAPMPAADKLAAPAPPLTTVQGPLRLPQGIDVGTPGVSYAVSYDDQGRVAKLDNGAGDRILVEYRYPHETPGLDLWHADGTFTSFDFYETHNRVSQGRFGEPPSVVMLLDRETGKQISETADGTVVTSEPQGDGQMAVTTRLLGQAAIHSAVDAQGQWSRIGSRVVRDGQGRPVKVMRAGRTLTATRYNDQGRPAEITLDGGAKVTYRYDDQDRLASTVDVYGGETRYAYEGTRRIRMILPDGTTERRQFDDAQRLVESVGPGGARQRLRYAGDHLIGATLEGLDTQVYLPFDEGRLSLAKSTLTGDWLFEKQDPDGRRIRRVDPLGRTVVFSYSDKGLLTGVQDDQGTALMEKTYDQGGNPTLIRTPDTQIERTFDREGRVLDETTWMTMQYRYDDKGIATQLTDSKAGDITYLRDEHGQLSEIQSKSAGTVKLSYGPFGLLETLERPNGLVTRWQYDQGGRLTGCTHTLGEQTITAKYSYDARGHLMKIEREPGEDTTFTRDAAGHCRQVNEGGEDTPFEFDAWGQILRLKKIGFVYDAAGRMQGMEALNADVKLDVRCDDAGRLAECGIPGGTVSNTYDWDHRLVTMDSPGTEEHYTWTYDGLGRLAAVSMQQRDETSKRHFAYAFDCLYAVVDEQAGIDRYIMIPGTRLCTAVIKASVQLDQSMMGKYMKRLDKLDNKLRKQGNLFPKDHPAVQSKIDADATHRLGQMADQISTFKRGPDTAGLVAEIGAKQVKLKEHYINNLSKTYAEMATTAKDPKLRTQYVKSAVDLADRHLGGDGHQALKDNITKIYGTESKIVKELDQEITRVVRMKKRQAFSDAAVPVAMGAIGAADFVNDAFDIVDAYQQGGLEGVIMQQGVKFVAGKAIGSVTSRFIAAVPAAGPAVTLAGTGMVSYEFTRNVMKRVTINGKTLDEHTQEGIDNAFFVSAADKQTRDANLTKMLAKLLENKKFSLPEGMTKQEAMRKVRENADKGGPLFAFLDGAPPPPARKTGPSLEDIEGKTPEERQRDAQITQQMIEFKEYRDGRQHGMDAAWTEDGTLQYRGRYDRGVQVASLSYRRLSSGLQKIEGNWINLDGKRVKHGPQRQFKNDILIREEFYDQGKKSGTWKEYHPNGQPKKVTVYQQDKKVEEANYYVDDKGKVRNQFRYDENENVIERVSYSRYDGHEYKTVTPLARINGKSVEHGVVKRYCDGQLERETECENGKVVN